MVNIGDTVEVTFSARDSLTDIRFYYDPIAELTERLSAAGFNVVSVTGPSGLFGGVWYDAWRVVLIPLTSAYGDVRHIAGIVAGAAEQIGMQVDNENAHGSVIAYGPGDNRPATTGQYQQNLAPPPPDDSNGFLKTVADLLGVSESTVAIGLTGTILIGAFLLAKK